MAKGTKQPSAKQQQVLDGLRGRKTITEIAESMDITVQAVYGHMARMKGKGIRVPRPKPASASAPAATASSNGSVNGKVEDVPAHVKAAVRAIDEAIDAETGSQAEASEEIRDLGEKIAVLQGRLTDVRAAAEASLGRTEGLRAAREKVPA